MCTSFDCFPTRTCANERAGEKQLQYIFEPMQRNFLAGQAYTCCWAAKTLQAPTLNIRRSLMRAARANLSSVHIHLRRQLPARVHVVCNAHMYDCEVHVPAPRTHARVADVTLV